MADLMSILPDYYKDNLTMAELQAILSNHITSVASAKDTVIDEMFVNTASNLLSRYENIYGVDVAVSKSDAFRRERIKAKMLSAGTTTKEMITNVSAAYSNGEVEVIEENSIYKFKVKFVGTVGVPGNMADLIITINEIKPAHIEVEFEYIYNTNATLKNFTHAQLAAYTHWQLRNEVIV